MAKTTPIITMAELAVLSKLQERREKESASFALADLSILDLETDSVEIRWATTGQKARIEAATIRFRDIHAEGRGSKRSSRRRTRTPPSSEIQSNVPKPETRKRKRTQTEPGGSQESNTSKDSTNVSSIVTAESDTKESWKSTASSDNEELDGSDDEAVVLRMLKKKKRMQTKSKIGKFAAHETQKKPEQRSDSSSAPTQVSGKISGSKGNRKQNDASNGDRSDVEEFGVTPLDNGKTNMTNFLKMKRFFSKFL